MVDHNTEVSGSIGSRVAKNGCLFGSLMRELISIAGQTHRSRKVDCELLKKWSFDCELSRSLLALFFKRHTTRLFAAKCVLMCCWFVQLNGPYMLKGSPCLVLVCWSWVMKCETIFLRVHDWSVALLSVGGKQMFGVLGTTQLCTSSTLSVPQLTLFHGKG